jgi:phosphatidate cytidylyltransferase
MLKTRVITAVVLLAVLLPVLYFANYAAFAVVAGAFFVAALWETGRLFGGEGQPSAAGVRIVVGVVAFAMLATNSASPVIWFVVSVALWALRFVPSLKIGLPPLGSTSNALLSGSYALALVGCFAAIIALFRHSPVYLLSVMALVWIADIGAYFAGKAFGKRKLAPSISPGKSWEGAIGGCIAVLVLAAASVLFGGNMLADTFAVHVQARFGWAALLAILALIVAASVVGDLFESQLKRRAGVKDSSKLLPGHGGVLDRIDALIPVLPLAALIGAWL